MGNKTQCRSEYPEYLDRFSSGFRSIWTLDYGSPQSWRSPGTNTYTLTSEGIRVAVFYTKLDSRLLRPLLEADKPPAPIELRHALGTIDHVLGDYITGARLGALA